MKTPDEEPEVIINENATNNNMLSFKDEPKVSAPTPEPTPTPTPTPPTLPP